LQAPSQAGYGRISDVLQQVFDLTAERDTLRKNLLEVRTAYAELQTDYENSQAALAGLREIKEDDDFKIKHLELHLLEANVKLTRRVG
jgi:hypothetical protein